MLDHEIREFARTLTSTEKKALMEIVLESVKDWRKNRISKKELIKHTGDKIKRRIRHDFYENKKEPTRDDMRKILTDIFTDLNLLNRK